MTDHRPNDPATNETEDGTQVPRDLPDQQARDGEDRLEVPTPEAPDERTPGPDESLPDMDETGAGPRGAPRSGSVHPEQPVPDEPSG